MMRPKEGDAGTVRSEYPFLPNGGGCKVPYPSDACGCEKRAKKSCDRQMCRKAMEELRKLEFAIVDTALYLDAYPHAECAIAYYHKLIDERDALRKTINETCGPVTIYENRSTDSWDWTDGPWPWEPDAN
jgi:spore coat protein JB